MPHKIPTAVSEAARALQAMRQNRKGGRPRTNAPRCPCGAMTAKRAAARSHKCPQEPRRAIQGYLEPTRRLTIRPG